MNLRNWSKQHTLGLLAGIISTLVFAFLIFQLEIVSKISFHGLLQSYTQQAKIISLACIPNLAWFHLSMKRKNYDFGMGVILSTFVYLFVVILYKFIL